MSIEVDYSGFERKAARYVNELGIAAPEVISDQSRLLLKALIKVTPPNNNSQGRKSVFSDIARSMTPIYPEGFTSKNAEGIKKMIAHRDFVGFNAFLHRQKGEWRAWDVKEFSPALHQSKQNARGRVVKCQKVFVFDAPKWKKYVAKAQSHVGREKCGWWPAYNSLGGSLPGWITRHSEGARGDVISGLNNKTFPTFTFSNRAKGIGAIAHQIRSALRIRSEAMGKDIRRRLTEITRKANAS